MDLIGSVMVKLDDLVGNDRLLEETSQLMQLDFEEIKY